jgi:hypothetical protein
MTRWLTVALFALASACSTPPAPATSVKTSEPTTPQPDPKPDPTPCGQTDPSGAGEGTGSAPRVDPTPAPPAIVGKLRDKCGTNDACEAPATCVKYYGIAGPRGPEFKTCEIKCDKPTKCPTGTSCGIVADGPGKVCR